MKYWMQKARKSALGDDVILSVFIQRLFKLIEFAWRRLKKQMKDRDMQTQKK